MGKLHVKHTQPLYKLYTLCGPNMNTYTDAINKMENLFACHILLSEVVGHWSSV